MNRKQLVALIATVAVVLAVVGVTLARNSSSSDNVVEAESTLPTPTASALPSSSTGGGTKPNQGVTPQSTTRPQDLPTVASLEELDTDKAQVSEELAEATVCGLQSSYFYEVVPRSGSWSQRIDAVRTGLPTIDENVAEWYLASDLDARIYRGVALAEKAQLQWGRAVALSDRGQQGASARALARGDRALAKLDQVNAAALCPR